MILFDRRKFIALEGGKEYERCKGWVSECHGKEVVNGRCGFFFIKPEWTVDTSDLVFSLDEYKKSDVRHLPWATKCDGKPVEVVGKALEVVGTNGITYGAVLDWCVEKTEQEKVEMAKTKYQVGDKVVVRNDLRIGRFYGEETFVASMIGYIGKTVTISDVIRDGMYCIGEDSEGYRWTDEMFVGLAASEVKINSGDVVTTRNGNKYLAIATTHGMMLMNALADGHMKLDNYDGDLKCGNGDYDVMSIHRPVVRSFNSAFKRINESNLIWERNEQPEAPEPKEQPESEPITDDDIKKLIDLLFEMIK